MPSNLLRRMITSFAFAIRSDDLAVAMLFWNPTEEAAPVTIRSRARREIRRVADLLRAARNEFRRKTSPSCVTLDSLAGGQK